jgi:hypothetical protein
MRGPDRLVILIKSPLIRNRDVFAQAPSRLEAEHTGQLPVCRTGAMQLRGLRRLNGEAPIVERQLRLQKPICGLQRRDLCQPQILDQSILDGLKGRSTRLFAYGK